MVLGAAVLCNPTLLGSLVTPGTDMMVMENTCLP